MAKDRPSDNIRIMVRTYRYLNDPEVRQVTIKFTAAFLATILLVALYVAVVTSGGFQIAPQPASVVNAEAGTPGAQTACFPQGTSTAWVQDNPDIRVIAVTESAEGWVCLSYVVDTFGP